MIKPVRLQLSRKRGAKLISPNGLPNVIVDRRSKWGNPFRTGDIINPSVNHSFLYHQGILVTEENCLELFRKYQAEPMREEAQRELRGKNLVCWCVLTQRCHADIWMEIANAEEHV